MTDQPAPTETPKVRPPRKYRVWWRAMLAVAGLPVVFVLASAIMLIGRDITLPSWMAARVSDRVNAMVDSGQVEFDAITLRIAPDLHPTVRLRGVRVRTPDGQLLARVPVIEGGVSPRGLILQRLLLFQTVRILAPQINLQRATDGTVGVVLGGGQVIGRAPSLPQLLQQADQFLDRPALTALEQIIADDMVINWGDSQNARRFRLEGGPLNLNLRGGRTALHADFAVAQDGADPTNITVDYDSPRGSLGAYFAVTIDGARAAALAAQAPGLGWLARIDAPLQAALRTRLDDSGTLGPLSASLQMGAGALVTGAAGGSVVFDGASAYLTYDPDSASLQVDEMAVRTAWGRASGEGTAFVQGDDRGLPRSILAQLQFRDIALEPGDMFAAPPDIAQADVDMRLTFDPFTVEVGQAVIQQADAQLLAHGHLRAVTGGWDIAADLGLDQIDPQALLAYWPRAFRPRTRNWIARNINGGDLYDLRAGLRHAPGQDPQLAFGFDFTGAQITSLRTLPPITDASGAASFEDHAFTVSLDAGTVLPDVGGPMQLAGTALTLVDLRRKPSPAILDLQIDSSVTAALSILNRPPFEYMDKANLPVTLADGRSVTRGQITWPLQPRPAPDSIAFDMTAELRNVTSTVLLPGRRFAAPRLTVKATRSGLTVAGPVRLDQATGRAQWDRRFGDPTRKGSVITADVALDQGFLDSFGVTLPPGTVAGAGRGDLRIDLQPGAPPAFSLRSDMAGLRLAIPAVGWVKGPGTRGDLQIEGTLGARPQIDRLRVVGGGLRAEGQIIIGPNNGLDRARFSRLRIGNWFDAPLTLVGQGPGQPPDVVIDGGRLDLRRAQFGAGGTGDGGNVRIALDRLQITEGIALTDFDGDFRNRQGFRGTFTARLNDAAAISGTVAPRNGRSAVLLRADDAGALLRSAGIARDVRGGAGELTLLPAGGAGSFDGRLQLRAVRLRNAPAMAAVLDAVSIMGLLQQMDGQGIAFDTVDARFRLTPTQIILEQASAVGPGLGISADGIYGLRDGRLNLQGVVSPFYWINSIGSFLSRAGEGLIGFNYSVTGTAADPQVSVNPLSALTPGMFRDIFRQPAPQVTR